MQQDLRFCRSFDGVEIATWKMGTGPPIVLATRSGGLWPPSALCQHPATRRIYERLSERNALFAYDSRGSGLSQRDADDYSLEASTQDLLAIVDEHGLGEFSLVGWRGTARTAADFAARWPGRVTRLVLRDPVFAPGDAIRLPRDRALAALQETDFEFYLQAMALSLVGWSAGQALAEIAAGGTTRDALVRSQQASADQVEPDLERIASSTLVVHTTTSASQFPLARARRVATSIKGARMVMIEGGHTYDAADGDQFADVILDFINPDRTRSRVDDGRGTAVILFTDIADSTALTERLGDAAFRDASRALDVRLRAAMSEAGGTPVEGKVLGDGVMAVFASAAQAIGAARRCVALSAEGDLRLHIGIHAGDVIREADNVYGGAVNIAARICALCDPGEILVSATIRDLARTSAGVTFADRGEHALKGIEDAVRVYAVHDGA